MAIEALAVTDHDNLCGAVEFAEACHDAGIQPIIGCEVTLAGGRHLTLLAETRTGYGNLCWLVSQAHIEDRRRPELDPAMLEGRTKGLIALSGCRRGEVPSLLDEQRFAEARDAASRYRDLFEEGNYFLELQQHLVQGDTRRNQRLASLAQELGVGVVAAGNVHYHIRERHRLQDCLVAVSNNTSLEESHRERRPNSEFFLKSSGNDGGACSSGVPRRWKTPPASPGAAPLSTWPRTWGTSSRTILCQRGTRPRHTWSRFAARRPSGGTAASPRRCVNGWTWSSASSKSTTWPGSFSSTATSCCWPRRWPWTWGWQTRRRRWSSTRRGAAGDRRCRC